MPDPKTPQTVAPNPVTPATGTTTPSSTSSTTKPTTTATNQSTNKQSTTTATKPATQTQGKTVQYNRASPEYGYSTLEKSHVDQRFSPPYTPVKLMFLTGSFEGQFLDLGTNSMTLSEEQSAEWEYTQGDSVRPGCNFKTISTRSWNLDLDYYDLNQDVRQLVEACFHLQEISESNKVPPDLQLIIGTATIAPVICRSVSPTYDTPLPHGKGFRHGVVQLKLELRPEPGSPHDLAPVLSRTYLTNYKQRTTATDRAKAGMLARTKALLDPCLGEQGSKQVEKLMAKDALGQPSELLKLDGPVFLQLVAAGLPESTLNDPQIQAKIKSDLAVVMTKEEDGMHPGMIRNVAQALVSGNTTAVPSTYLQPTNVLVQDKDGNRSTQTRSLFEMMKGDYDIISDALLQQKLGPQDPVFDRSSYPTASQRLMQVAQCGIQLRKIGGVLVPDSKGNEAITLGSINDTLANPELSDEQIKKLFGLPSDTPETVMRRLRGNGPYKTKEEFLKEAAPNRQGFTAYNMWSAFSGSETQNLADINKFIAKEGVTEDEIAKAFKISKEEAKKMKEAKNFKDKASFLKVFGDLGTTSSGLSAWTNFKLEPPKSDSAPL